MPPEIEVDKVCYIIFKAREFDVKDVVTDDDSGSDPMDDDDVDVLEDQDDDPTEEELTTFIDDLNVDEQAELVALTWVGRGDFGADEWEDALDMAVDRQAGKTSRYLLGIPILADYLAEGLAAFGLSCTEDGLAGVERDEALGDDDEA